MVEMGQIRPFRDVGSMSGLPESGRGWGGALRAAASAPHLPDGAGMAIRLGQMARSKFAPRLPIWRPPVVRSQAEVDQRRASLAAFILAHGRRGTPAPTQEQHSMQGQPQPLFDAQHTVVFHRSGGAKRMGRAEAAALVKDRPHEWSYDHWADLQDVASRHEIPADWQRMTLEAKRELMARLRLPRGSIGGRCCSHVTVIDYELSQRASRRAHLARSAVQ